jgi:hypothetical protein
MADDIDTHVVYYRVDGYGRTALMARDDADAIKKAAIYDKKWSPKGNNKTKRIVKSVNTVIWRAE